ncbi:hypothetical protein DUI87_30225 [Hirundo rustica rustica]|uniref:Torsin-1A C-terminal domain-containing protein n=1 Tax=Hirundo rustica rustica TaxID=333673 RepID=A0A3M0IXP6_HIRRU|nr:hypothetical protein DUI87_30225 [Hirundo rustica rustica]
MEEELPCSEVDGKSVLKDLGVEMPCVDSDPTGDTSGVEKGAGEVPCAESSTREEAPCDPGIVFTRGSLGGETLGSGSDGEGEIPSSGSDGEGEIPGTGRDREGEIPGGEGEIPVTDSDGEGEMPCDAKGEASCSESDAEEVPDAVIPAAKKKIASISSPLRAIIRLRRHYRGLKKRRLHLELPREKSAEFVHTRLLQRQLSVSRAPLYSPSMSFFNQSGFESSQYFTFDTSVEHYSVKKCRRKKSRRKYRMVLYPDKTKKYLPAEEKSKAKRCLLLLIAIIFFQILNAIENLDDNLQKYDLDALEKTMHREVFGQKVAVESIMELLKDYLATHVHNKPLVISLNGPTGVGKSHVGWVLAKHFRSVMDNDFVLQYFVMHHCPSGVPPLTCEIDLRFFEPNQTNEFLNAIYILISNLGGAEITKFVIQNASTELLHQQRGAEELLSIIQPVLAGVHPLWKAADIIPFVLLEKSHVINCFLEQMRREGLYPDQKHIENLANQLSYYTTGDKQYSSMGCKQVVAKVNLL